jgi:xanthine dehydrogenase accessory factor
MTMPFFDRLAKLEREHASFAIATVVARRSPVSSHLGDRALIFADGRMEGFVGGSCARDIVRRQALGAIRNRQPVLLQIRNAADLTNAAAATVHVTPAAPNAASGTATVQRPKTSDAQPAEASCCTPARVDETDDASNVRTDVAISAEPAGAACCARAGVAETFDASIGGRHGGGGNFGVDARANADDDPASNTELVVIPMSCASEGAVDVYIEPRVPLRRLVVVGFTPVAQALAQTATALDYNVVRVVIDDELRDLGDESGIRVIALGDLRDFATALDAHDRESLVAIVASQGHYDELALDVLARLDLAFVGLLASRRRAATVFGVLAQQGVPAERLAMIRTPVGLDIGARSPGEVAISILAEIIANAPATGHVSSAPARSALSEPAAANASAAWDPPADANRPAGATAPAVANDSLMLRGPSAPSTTQSVEVDPVCHMDVETANALYSLDHDGRAFFFCCAGCRASFAAAPERYLVTRGTA